ncbi:hypothetical protein D3C80_1572140 [compost metagenome]
MCITVAHDATQSDHIEKGLKAFQLLQGGCKYFDGLGDMFVAFTVFAGGAQPHEYSHVFKAERVQMRVTIKAAHDEHAFVFGQIELWSGYPSSTGN